MLFAAPPEFWGGGVSIIQSAARRIADRVQATPDKTIYRFLERGEVESVALTYGELDDRARRLAGLLLDRRLGGERLLLVFEPGAHFVVTLIACLYAGAIAIPAPAPRPGASLERLQGMVAGARPRVLLTTAELAAGIGAQIDAASALGQIEMVAVDAVETGPPVRFCPGIAIAPTEPVLVQYTSGSTLAPRGVVLDSAGLTANIDYACAGIGFGLDGEDRFVNWMPHYHDMGLVGNLILPLAMGHESVHLPPLAFVQQPARWLHAIGKYRGTASGGPPLAFDSCVARIPDETIDSLDLSSWRIAFCGAEPVFEASLRAFRERFARAHFPARALFCVYGLAEVAVYAAGSPPPSEAPPAADEGVGTRAPCHLDEAARTALRIVSPDGRPMPEGAEGEIWISCRSVAAGYLDDPDATERTFRNRLEPDDGRLYLATGDLGTIAGAVLRITGRIKDVLIRHGVNIVASDVERLATEGLPQLNPNGAAAFQGEGPDTPIVLLLEKPRGPWDEGAEPDLVRAIRRSVIAGLGIAVDEIRFVEPGALPRTTSGKIQRARARAQWAADPA